MPLVCSCTSASIHFLLRGSSVVNMINSGLQSSEAEKVIMQTSKLEFRLRELTSCLCSAAASTASFECHVAVLNTTESGNELS